MKYAVSCSIVLYKNDEEEIKTLVSNILNSHLPVYTYLIDNSPTDILSHISKAYGVEYHFNNANLGYGAGHNIAIQKSISQGMKYHIVCNPDITLGPDVIPSLYNFMEENRDIGQVIPKVHFEDGSTESVCKLLPAPIDLFGRRFLPNNKRLSRRNQTYELHQFNYDRIINAPSLSGCFMFLRTEILGRSGIFDPQFFMYMEDYDLVRRIHHLSRTVIFPFVFITHKHRQESYKSMRMTIIHLRSAFAYFNKWGWFFDRERNNYNRRLLEDLEKTAISYYPANEHSIV